MFHIGTLRQKLTFFLLVPVTFLLFGSVLITFIYVRHVYLSQWQEAALLKLERASHYIDMRLQKPLDVIRSLDTEDRSQARSMGVPILESLRALPGVTDVFWEDLVDQPASQSHRSGAVPFCRIRISAITQPKYDATAEMDAIAIVAHLLDREGNIRGRLETRIRFDYLMEGIRELGWKRSDMASVIDDKGRHLFHITGGNKAVRPVDGEMVSNQAGPNVLEALEKNSSGTLLSPGNFPEKVIGYHRLENAPWSLVLEGQGVIILAPLIRMQLIFFTGCLILIFSILMLIRMNVERIVASICTLSRAAQDVARGKYGDTIPVDSYDEIGNLIDSYNSMVEGLKERDFVRNTFGRYVDEDVARELLSHPNAVRLGGERREVAILMSDIRGFTPLSETLNPEKAIQMLNTYFGHMIDAVKTHKGIIVDFVGDALLVFFDPLQSQVQWAALRCVNCALDMQARMSQFNREIQATGLAQVEMGIGVHVGTVVVGNIGSETRAKYGIVGAAVNLTQRIEGKASGGQTVLSEACYRLLSDYVEVGPPTFEDLKGVLVPINLYPLRGLKVHP